MSLDNISLAMINRGKNDYSKFMIEIFIFASNSKLKAACMFMQNIINIPFIMIKSKQMLEINQRTILIQY